MKCQQGLEQMALRSPRDHEFLLGNVSSPLRGAARRGLRCCRLLCSQSPLRDLHIYPRELSSPGAFENFGLKIREKTLLLGTGHVGIWILSQSRLRSGLPVLPRRSRGSRTPAVPTTPRSAVPKGFCSPWGSCSCAWPWQAAAQLWLWGSPEGSQRGGCKKQQDGPGRKSSCARKAGAVKPEPWQKRERKCPWGLG